MGGGGFTNMNFKRTPFNIPSITLTCYIPPLYLILVALTESFPMMHSVTA